MRRHPRATYTCLHGSNLPASGPAEEKCGQMIDSGFNLRPKDWRQAMRLIWERRTKQCGPKRTWKPASSLTKR